MTQQITIPLATLEQLVGALKDAATSLETIRRLAGKTHYVGDDGERVETYMAHHDQVRGYAGFRASVAQEAITAGRVALANSEPAGWQPIETAPKDGSFYLAFGGGKTWTQNQPNGCYPGEWHFSESRGEWRGCVISKEATHWMPLPAAPKDTL